MVFAGVDYRGHRRAEAQQEADIIVWDGGNNDFSFIRSDLEIVVSTRSARATNSPTTPVRPTCAGPT